MEEVTKKILSEVPKPVKLDEVMAKYPVLYEESMNTVLVQEVIRWCQILMLFVFVSKS